MRSWLIGTLADKSAYGFWIASNAGNIWVTNYRYTWVTIYTLWVWITSNAGYIWVTNYGYTRVTNLGRQIGIRFLNRFQRSGLCDFVIRIFNLGVRFLNLCEIHVWYLHLHIYVRVHIFIYNTQLCMYIFSDFMIRFRNLGVRLRDLCDVGMICICVYIHVFMYVRLYIHNIRVLHSWNMPPRSMRFICHTHTYTYVYIHVCIRRFVYTKHLCMYIFGNYI